MMTPDEAQKTLYEAGFFSRWDNRVLYGGTEYKPGNPGVFDGRRFEVTLLRLGVAEARLTDFEGESTLIDAGTEGKKDLGSIVQRLIALLDRNLEEPVKVPLWAAVELGRAAPTASTEVEALSTLFWPSVQLDGDSVPSRFMVPPPPLPNGLTEEQRLELPEPERPRQQVAWGPLRQPFESTLPSATPERARSGKYRRPYGARAGTMATHTRRGFHWAPLSAHESWPTKLHEARGVYGLSQAREMETVHLVSAIRQALDYLPEWVDLIVFSTEPVEGKVTARLHMSRAEVPDAPKPDWLMALLATATVEPSYPDRNLG